MSTASISSELEGSILSKWDWVVGLLPTFIFIIFLVINFPTMVGILADLLAFSFYLTVLGLIYLLRYVKYQKIEQLPPSTNGTT